MNKNNPSEKEKINLSVKTNKDSLLWWNGKKRLDKDSEKIDFAIGMRLGDYGGMEDWAAPDYRKGGEEPVYENQLNSLLNEQKKPNMEEKMGFFERIGRFFASCFNSLKNVIA